MAAKPKPKPTAKKPAAAKKKPPVIDRQARRAIAAHAKLVRIQYSRMSSPGQEAATAFLAEADKCGS